MSLVSREHLQQQHFNNTNRDHATHHRRAASVGRVTTLPRLKCRGCASQLVEGDQW